LFGIYYIWIAVINSKQQNIGDNKKMDENNGVQDETETDRLSGELKKIEHRAIHVENEVKRINQELMNLRAATSAQINGLVMMKDATVEKLAENHIKKLRETIFVDSSQRAEILEDCLKEAHEYYQKKIIEITDCLIQSRSRKLDLEIKIEELSADYETRIKELEKEVEDKTIAVTKLQDTTDELQGKLNELSNMVKQALPYLSLGEVKGQMSDEMTGITFDIPHSQYLGEPVSSWEKQVGDIKPYK
jgi:hypothetical protein